MKKESKYLFLADEIKSISDAVFTEKQIDLIKRKTPVSEIEIVEKNNKRFKTVKASYMKKRMALIFGWDYDFEIKSREFIPSTKEVLVEGRLTIRSGIHTIIREQFGQHYLSSKASTDSRIGSKAIDIGNGYKSAASDAFKKCCAEIGICWDIYGQEVEQIEEQTPAIDHSDIKIVERLKHFLEECNTTVDVENIYSQFIATNEEKEVHKKLLDKHMKRTIKK